jgi:hypothetical protein
VIPSIDQPQGDFDSPWGALTVDNSVGSVEMSKTDYKDSKEAMDYIDHVAQESGNRRAFYHGLVFGLGQADGFIRIKGEAEARAYIQSLLDHVDGYYFKKEQL